MTPCPGPRATPGGSHASTWRLGTGRRRPRTAQTHRSGRWRYGRRVPRRHGLRPVLSPDVGGQDVDGIYRVDGPHRLPSSPTSVRIRSHIRRALRSSFRPAYSPRCSPAAADSSSATTTTNPVLQMRLDGQITQVITFGDIVPDRARGARQDLLPSPGRTVPHFRRTARSCVFPATRSPDDRVRCSATGRRRIQPGRRALRAFAGALHPGHPDRSTAEARYGCARTRQ